MAEKLPRARWYVVQTYSGKEKAVKQDLEHRIESLNMTDLIYQVVVPEEKYIEKNKDGKEEEKIRVLFPGYLFVEMIVTDDSWYQVRNTPSVTGILGSSGGGTKPVPLLDEEIKRILTKAGLLAKANYNHLIGRQVQIIEGPFKGKIGEVTMVDNDQEKMNVNIEIFERSTPAEIDFKQFKEI